MIKKKKKKQNPKSGLYLDLNKRNHKCELLNNLEKQKETFIKRKKLMI